MMNKLPSFSTEDTNITCNPTAFYRDERGYDQNGYDVGGYDKDGYDKDGYDREGYDRSGYDVEGYDVEGYDEDGYDAHGYDIDGYSKDGYNAHGYDIDGYSKEGYDENNRDKKGHSKNFNKVLDFSKSGVKHITKGLNVKANDFLQLQIQDCILGPFIDKASDKLARNISLLKGSLLSIEVFMIANMTAQKYHELMQRIGKKCHRVLPGIYQYKYSNTSGAYLHFNRDSQNIRLKAYYYGEDRMRIKHNFLKFMGNVPVISAPMSPIDVLPNWPSNNTPLSNKMWENIVSKYKKEIEIYLQSWTLANKNKQAIYNSIQTGFIFQGPPGSGKSTLALAIADFLGYKTQYIDFNGDIDLQFKSISSNSVVIMEDIDILMGTVSNDYKDRTTLKDKATLSKLSKVMNLIDGKVKYDHVVFIATTNNLEALDKALTRKGRFNKTYYVGPFNEKEIREYCLKQGVNPDNVIKEHGNKILPADLKALIDEFLAARQYYLSIKRQEFLLEKLSKGNKNEDNSVTSTLRG